MTFDLFIERGYVRDGITLTLPYTVDETGTVFCNGLSETQIVAFSAYVAALPLPSHGNSLRESTPEEIHFWEAFVETLLVCSECGEKPVRFNPFLNQFLCPTHQTGLETGEN
jgi:hypothetical protein